VIVNSADVSISQESKALVTQFVFDLCRTCRKPSVFEARTNTTVFTDRHGRGRGKET